MLDIIKEYQWTNPETGLKELIDVNVNSIEGKKWLENEGVNAILTSADTPETGNQSGDATVDASATSTTPASNQEVVQPQNNQQENTGSASVDTSLDSQNLTEVVKPTTKEMDESTRLMTTYKNEDENSEDFYNRITPQVTTKKQSVGGGHGAAYDMEVTNTTINGITKTDNSLGGSASYLDINGNEATDDQIKTFEELFLLNQIHSEANEIRSTKAGDYSELSDSEIINQQGGKWDIYNKEQEVSDKVQSEMRTNKLDSSFDYDYQSHLEWEQQQYVDGLTKHSAAENAKLNTQYNKERQAVANEILPVIQDQIQQKYSGQLKEIETGLVDTYNKRFDVYQKSTLASYEKLAKKAKTQKEIDKINSDYQRDLKAWWDGEQPKLQDEYSRLVNETYGDAMKKDLNSALNNNEQIVALDESWQSEFEEAQNNIYENYKNNYKPESKHFSEEDFERISRDLDKAGFDVANSSEKKYMLQKYLSNLEKVQGGTPEDIEEIKNEFYAHYYDKLESQPIVDASGKVVIDEKTGEPKTELTQFVMKDIATATLNNAQELYDKEIKKYKEIRYVDKRLRDEPEIVITPEQQLFKDNPGLEQAMRYSRQILDNPESAHPAGAVNFFRGMGSLEGHKYIPFAGGLIDLGNSLEIKALADKAAAGETTPMEDSALQMYLLKNQSDAQVRKLSTAYNAGAMFAESAPFMAEMVITSGAFNTTKQVVQQGVKKALTKSIDKVAGTQVAKSLRFKKGTGKMLFAPKNNAYKVVDNVGDAIGGILATVAQTTANPQRYLAGAIDNMTPEMAWAYTDNADDLISKLDLDIAVKGEGDSFPKAFAKSFGTAWSEYATERMGWLVPGLGKAGLKKLGVTQSPEWLKRASLGRYLRKNGLHKTEAIKHFIQTRSGWNGVLGEMSEEFMNIPLSNLINGHDLTEGLDWPSIKEMGISISAGGLAFGGGTMLYNKAAGNKAPGYYIDLQRFENEKAAIAHLKKMKKNGTLNENTDIEITNDFQAYDNVSKVLEEAGLSNDIIKTGGSGVNAGHIAAAEVEFMNELSQEDRNELESIDGEIKKLEADKGDVNQRDNTDHKEVHAINENIKKLNRRRESILEPVKAKVKQFKTDIYEKKLNNLRKILGEDKYDEVVTEANSQDEVNAMLEQAVAESNGLTKQGDQWVNNKGEVVDISEAVKSGQNKHGGFYVDENTGKKKIFINREASLGESGNVDVGSHEFLHYFLSETLHHHPELKLAFGKALQSHVFNIDPRQIRDTGFRNRLIGYQKRGDVVSMEETLNILSDAMANGTYQHNETALTKLGDIIRRTMSSFGVRVNFGNGRDVFNFIKDYNKEFESGKLSKGMKATMKKGVKVSGQIQDLAESEQKRLKTDVKALNKGIRKVIPDWQDLSVQEAVDARMVFSESATKKTPKESPLEAINKLLPKNIKTNQDYQDFTQDQREFPKLYSELMQPGGVINNYIRSRQTSKEEGDKMLDEAMMRLINFKPENKRKDGSPVGIEGFGEFIFANTRFAKLVAKKKLFEESEELKRKVSTDTEQAKQIADTPTPTDQAPAKGDKAPVRTNVLKVSGVESKAEDIKKMVDIKEGEDIDFKGVTSKYSGKAAEMIFGVPASKITDPKKNLTYAKKIVDGIPEPSEAGNIQKFYTSKDNVRKLLRILKNSNVTSEQAYVNKIGESIDVARGVTGRSIGLKGVPLKYFFEPVLTEKGTRARSKGLTSQTPLWRLKPKFRGNVSNEVVAEVQRDFGITPTGQLNKYDRGIGQLLKGIANYQADQTVLSAAQRNLEEARSKADVEGKKAIGEQIANITAAQSKLAFSENFSEEQVKAAVMNQNAVVSTSKLLKIAGLPNYLADRAAKAIIKRSDGKEVKHVDYNYIVAREAGKEARSDKTIGEEVTRITQALHKMDPVYSTLFKIGMSNGWGKSFFGVNSKFDELSKIPKEELEALPPFLTRFMYHEKELLNPKRVVEENGEIYYIVGNLKKKGESKKLTAKEFLELDKQKLDFLEKMFEDIKKHLKKNPNDAWFFARWVTDASSNQSSIFRTSAPVIGFYYKDGKLHYNVKLREEHSTPQNNIGTMFLGAAINGESISDVGKVARASFVQLSLTHEHDDMLKAIKDKDGNIIRQSLEANMPDEYWSEVVPNILNGNLDWLDLGMAAMIRYARAGVNLNEYIVPGLGKTITEYFGVGVDMSKLNPKQVEALVEIQNDLISDILTGKITRKVASDHIEASRKLDFKSSKDDIKALKNYKVAKDKISASMNGKTRGMSTFDFDETLIIGGDNFVIATDPDTGHEVKISSEQWPVQGPELAAAGYKFDFSDFANVRGGKEGPLLQKMKNQIEKYGPNNVFILTARQQASAVPIHRWLKSKGINIPLRNITGLGKSEGSAKADWMLQKYAEGYNDMYFVDDAMSNVKAVKDVLDQLDIKSKVVQAKINFSESGSDTFNEMLDRNTGVPKEKIFSDAQARLRGKKAGGFRFFVPPSAEDFKGLLYNFLGKGKQGDADMAFFKEHLLDPFAKGIRDINSTKQRTSEEYKELRKKMPEVAKRLNKKIPNSDYSVGDAMRVYLWSNNGIEIPGISEQEVSFLSDHINGDGKLKSFADALGKISRSKNGYVKPGENWVVGSIASDLHEQTSEVNRAELLSEWKANRDIIFSPENMNKIEAVYGTDFRDALENMLERMETGSNRTTGKKDKVVNSFMDWINGSVGAVMFFNTRSAVLQTLSMVNFINWGDNNIFQAGKAFANQPQYWKDFLTLFNSDMLKQRRAGMAIDVNLAELSNAVSKASGKEKAKAAIRYLLQIGFTPTQIADSFAIAAGGSTFYRNRTNKYIKEGLSQKEAETKAFDDFQEIAEETQQSSRPDLISQQQAGALGRLVLAWQNTPMQYTRLTKKAISDLVNGRGDWKQNVSRILYYGAAQNIIFGSLQTGLAFLMFGGDEDEEKTKTKTTRVANGALDTLLRGTGVYGAMASTLKNVIMKYADERKKPYGKRELSKVGIEAMQLSPPIGSKIRKIMSAIYSYEYNLGVPEKIGWNINNPILNVISSAVEAVTNVPLDRGVRKAQNLDEAINGNHEMWKRVALFLGWDKWGLSIKNEELEEAKAEVKEERAEKKKKENEAKKEEKKRLKEEENEKEKKEKEAQGIKEVRCSGIKSNGKRCSIKIETKEKKVLCGYHKTYKEGEASDRDGDGVKEYRCTGTTGSGKRCKNRTERTNKKCYAHQ